MKLIKIQVIPEDRIIRVEVVGKAINPNNSSDFLNYAYEQIGCDTIDVITLGYIDNEKHFTITVDDEGLMKSSNPVLKITVPIEGEGVATRELAGTLLIGRSENTYNEEEGYYEGYSEVGLTDEAIQYFMDNVKIELLGFTH